MCKWNKTEDIVISTNPDTLETSGKTVLETYVRQVDKLVYITINGEEIVTTNNHPFYVQGRGFIDAGNLLVGDKLISVNGEDVLIEDYLIELTEESVSVYNFQVEDYHTYFVGKSNIWTHNAECGGSYKEVCEKNKEYNSNQSDYIKNNMPIIFQLVMRIQMILLNLWILILVNLMARRFQ